MTTRSPILTTLGLVAVLAICNYLSIYTLMIIDEWRDRGVKVETTVERALIELERYILTGDEVYLEATDERLAVLEPAWEVTLAFFAPEPDWDEIRALFHKYEDNELLADTPQWRLHIIPFIPGLSGSYRSWESTETIFEDVIALRAESQRLWSGGELDGEQQRALSGRLRSIEATVAAQSLGFHQILSTATTTAQRLLIVANILIYGGLLLFLLSRSRRIVGTKEREARRARKMLQEEETLHRTVVRQTHEAICILRADTLEVSRFNPAFCALLGYGLEECSDLCLQDFATTSAQNMEQYLNSHFTDGEGEVQQAQWMTAQGTTKTVEVSATPISGEESWLVLVARDLTKKREIDARLANMDRMAAVGMLATGVGHEINNPLAYVASNLDFAIRGLRSPGQQGVELSTDEIGLMLEALEEAQHGAGRIRDIVADLKHLTRWQAAEGRDIADLEVVLNATIRMAGSVTSKRARVIGAFDGIGKVRGAESRLGQVFLNLVINAAQAIPEGDAANQEIRIEAQSMGKQVRVQISDTGVGIAPEHLDRLFETFFSTKSAAGGTGLGLPICRHILDRIGGRIQFESVVGEGTTVSVWLEAVVKDSETPTPESGEVESV